MSVFHLHAHYEWKVLAVVYEIQLYCELVL